MKIKSILELKAFRSKTQKIVSESRSAVQTPMEGNSCASQEPQPSDTQALELTGALMSLLSQLLGPESSSPDSGDGLSESSQN